MKIKPKIYAVALAEAITSGKEKIASNFLNILEKNGDLKKAKEIIALAEKLFIKKTGGKKIILETAREVGSEDLLKMISGKNDVVVNKINPEIIAGVKIVVDDEKQLDFSLQNKLNKIFS